MAGKINVLVVEDSGVAREYLVHLLSADPQIEVVGTASDGKTALEAVEKLRPHVITMDVHMPHMNGLKCTRRIMETHPTPIVIVSASWDVRDVSKSFLALEAGALAIARKPEAAFSSDESLARELINTVKLMAEVKVVRRWADRPAAGVRPRAELEHRAEAFRIIAIGASTGGPQVLQTLLSSLGPKFPLPIMIVQHMADIFIPGFVDWLANASKFPVVIAQHGASVRSGTAYIAPGDCHMGVTADLRIQLDRTPAENGHCPSVSHLFRSVAETFGRRAVGILLTGMGRDGADELALMKERGGLTIAQDQESSVIHGMPGEAIKLGAALHVLNPVAIGAALRNLAATQTAAQLKS